MPAAPSNSASSVCAAAERGLGGRHRFLERAGVAGDHPLGELGLGDLQLHGGIVDRAVGGGDRRGAGLLGDDELALGLGVGLLGLGGGDVEGGDPFRRVRLAGVGIDRSRGAGRIADGHGRVAHGACRVAGGPGAGDLLVLHEASLPGVGLGVGHGLPSAVDRLLELQALRLGHRLLGIRQGGLGVGHAPLRRR